MQWVRVFIKGSGLRHLRDMGRAEIEAFLTMLAAERRVAASTHNQALSALLAALPPETALVARLLEGLRLRVKDVEFDRQVFVVRESKGNKDRVLMLPRTLAAELRS